MLRRGLPWASVAVLVLTGGLHAAVQEPALAQGNVVCAEWDEALQSCLLELTVSLDGNPPTVAVSVSGGEDGYQVWCDRGSNYNPEPQLAQLREVPCHHDQHGWYSQEYDCYFLLAVQIPPEAPGVILPDGYQPGNAGAVYSGMCFSTSHPDIELENYCFCTPPRWFGSPHYVFLTSRPDGFGGTADPVPELLVSAIDEMALEGPAIGTAPPAGQGAGLVRLPVWLWNDVSGNNWGTVSAIAGPIAGISVVAEARATGIEWAMGDGNTVQCDEGVAWEPGMNVLSPPCGHAYSRASRHQPGGVYEISATTTWVLEWQTQGLPAQRGGAFDLNATSTTTLQIDEIQVLTSR
jgi:hypothetical protein